MGHNDPSKTRGEGDILAGVRMPSDLTGDERTRICAIVAALVERADSQEALAASLGVSQTMISRSARGMELFPKLVRQLARAFDCTIDELSTIDPLTRAFRPVPDTPVPSSLPSPKVSRNLGLALAYHAEEGRWPPEVIAIAESGRLAHLPDVLPRQWAERLDAIESRVRASIDALK